MKRLLIIAFALALVGCGKQAQAETTPTTEATIAEQASKEVEELTKLEEEGKIKYDEVSGDIINNEQETQNQDMMNVIRQEVIDGDIKGNEIDEEVDMWCEFLSDTEKSEFKSELHLLEAKEAEVVPETHETKSQTSSKPKETQSSNKPAPQPTQSTEVTQPTQPAVTESAQTQPTQPVQQPTVEPGSTVKDANGNEVHRGKLDTNQTLSDEQIDAINNSTWN